MNNTFLSFLVPVITFLPLGCRAVAEQSPPPPELETSVLFTQAELDQMLAPIALYPDALLSQVLMAATYPLEIVEASRWSRETELQGEDAVNAAQEQNWDISIKSLVAFPDLIQLMDEQLSWTRRLGDAFLLQEEQVMETVQMLRRRSLEEGNLDSLEHLVVREEEKVIIVEPREVEVVYVPYYNTRYVYGDWWWYDYPPVYWHYPRYSYNRIGFSWSIGWRVSSRFYFSFCDWHHWDIVLHHHRWNHGRDHRPVRKDIHYVHHDRDRGGYAGYHDRGENDRRPGDRDVVANSNLSRNDAEDIKAWSHNPYHRRGVEYRGEMENEYSARLNSADLATASRPSRTSQPQRSSIRQEAISRTSTRREDSTSVSTSSRTFPSMSNRVARSTTESRSVTPGTSRDSTSRMQSGSSRSGTVRSDSQGGTTPPTSRTRIANTSRPDASTSAPASNSRSYERPSSSRSYSSSSSSRTSPPATMSRSSSGSSRPDTSRSVASSSRGTPAASSTGRSYSGSSSSSSSSSRSYSSPSSSGSSRSYSSGSSSGSSRMPSRSSQSVSRSSARSAPPQEP